MPRYETIKATNEIEAEKFEEQLRNIQKKMQVKMTLNSKLYRSDYIILYVIGWSSILSPKDDIKHKTVPI